MELECVCLFRSLVDLFCDILSVFRGSCDMDKDGSRV